MSAPAGTEKPSDESETSFDAVDEAHGAGEPAGAPPANRRRAAVAWTLVLGATALLAAFIVRGERADETARDPAEAKDGSVCQLLALPGGGKQIRCAQVIDAPAADVWGVVTDYEHFREIFPYIETAKATKETDNLYLFEGKGGSHVGTWEWSVHVRHTIGPDVSTVSWDQPDERFKVNRGGWSVKPLGPSRTLLVYAVELEVSPYPKFIVRNVLLSRLPDVVGAVEKRLHPAKK